MREVHLAQQWQCKLQVARIFFIEPSVFCFGIPIFKKRGQSRQMRVATLFTAVALDELDVVHVDHVAFDPTTHCLSQQPFIVRTVPAKDLLPRGKSPFLILSFSQSFRQSLCSFHSMRVFYLKFQRDSQRALHCIPTPLYAFIIRHSLFVFYSEAPINGLHDRIAKIFSCQGCTVQRHYWPESRLQKYTVSKNELLLLA